VSATTYSRGRSLPQIATSLAEGSRVLCDLAADVQANPCTRTLDAFLAQTRGLALLGLRAHRELGGDPPPPPPGDPLAPIGRAA
jgi:hypothetical protein